MNKMKIIAVVIAIPLLLFGGYGLSRAWTYYFGATIEGKVGAEKQLESSQSRISKYNEFYDLCSSVQSLEQSLRQQRKALENSEDKKIIQSNINGLVAQRAQTVNQYNANARKSYTKARFKASDLPSELPMTFDENSPITSCTANQ